MRNFMQMQVNNGLTQLGPAFFKALEAATRPAETATVAKRVEKPQASVDLDAAQQALSSGRNFPRGSFVNLNV